MNRRDVEVALPNPGIATARPRYVVIVGEKPTIPAPSYTLSKSLARLDIETRFADANQMSRAEWLRLLKGASAIVLVSYAELGTYLVSQLATAVALSIPIVRWWVGTDVLNAISSKSGKRNAQRTDWIVSKNVAVAPHLVDELATVGIRAQYVPSVIDTDMSSIVMADWAQGTKPVLVYLPGRRKKFFGIDAIEPVVVSNPDLTFIVVGDETHSLARHPNVESLGWVADMSPLYLRAGCILRVTEHDGLPRMLIEAMLRGLYAIYSWPLLGSWQARSAVQIDAALARYRSATRPNIEGRLAMLSLLSEQPDQKMSSIIGEAATPLSRRMRGISVAVHTGIFAGRT
jgi:hypothetical protein